MRSLFYLVLLSLPAAFVAQPNCTFLGFGDDDTPTSGELFVAIIIIATLATAKSKAYDFYLQELLCRGVLEPNSNVARRTI